MRKSNLSKKPVICVRCGNQVIRTGNCQKYCKGCGKKVKLEYIKKYFSQFKVVGCSTYRGQKFWKSYISSKEKDVRVIKRMFPPDKSCELCGQKPKKRAYNYHHWGEIQKDKYVKGIYVCNRCHGIVEIFDENPNFITKIIEKYLTLRNKIESEGGPND